MKAADRAAIQFLSVPNNLVFTLVIHFQCETLLDIYASQLNLGGKWAKPLECRSQVYMYVPLQSFQQPAVQDRQYRHVKLRGSALTGNTTF